MRHCHDGTRNRLRHGKLVVGLKPLPLRRRRLPHTGAHAEQTRRELPAWMVECSEMGVCGGASARLEGGTAGTRRPQLCSRAPKEAQGRSAQARGRRSAAGVPQEASSARCRCRGRGRRACRAAEDLLRAEPRVVLGQPSAKLLGLTRRPSPVGAHARTQLTQMCRAGAHDNDSACRAEACRCAEACRSVQGRAGGGAVHVCSGAAVQRCSGAAVQQWESGGGRTTRAQHAAELLPRRGCEAAEDDVE